MTHRDHPRGPGLIGALIAACFALPVLWKTVSVTIADLTWSTAPQTALSFDPDFAKARQVFATRKLLSDLPDRAEAEQQFKEAIRRDPLAPSIVSALAKTYASQRQIDRAQALWTVAAKLTWRDGEAQVEAFQIAFAERDFVRAVSHFDALMRVFPGQNGKTTAFIVPYLEMQGFREALYDLVASNPPWRASFLKSINQPDIPVNILSALYTRLKGAAVPLTQDELRPYVKRLIASALYDHAYLVWLGTLPDALKPDGSLLYNHDFEFPVSNMPFDWNFDPVAGIDMTIEKRAFARILRVTFLQTRSVFQNVRQILLLSPGEYVFSGRESADSISNDRGVRWRIRCMKDAAGALALTSPVSGTMPWRDFRVEFSVPRGCPVQEIFLEIPARTRGERSTNGSVGYTSLLLERRTASATMP